MPADAPKAKLPVLRKVTALVMAVPVAFKPKLYVWLAVVKVGVVSAPLNAMLPLVSSKATLVVVSTAPPKVVPPDWVKVKLAMLVPMLRVMLTVPVLLMTILDGQLRLSPKGAATAMPAIEPMVMVPALPLPKVKVTPLPSTMLSKVMGSAPKSKVIGSPTKRLVPLLKLMPQSPVQLIRLVLVKLPAITLVPA